MFSFFYIIKSIFSYHIASKLRLFVMLASLLLLINACDQIIPSGSLPSPELNINNLLVEKVLFNNQVPSKIKFVPEIVDSIEIFFNNPIDTVGILLEDYISFTNKETGDPVVFAFEVKDGDSTILLRSMQEVILELGVEYTLRVSGQLQSSLAGITFSEFAYDYSTPLLDDVSLKVFYETEDDEIQVSDLVNFYKTISNRNSLAGVNLIFEPGRQASLVLNGAAVQLTDSKYSSVFDFSSGEPLTVRVVAQNKNTIDYNILVSQREPMKLVSAGFEAEGFIPAKYATRLDLSKPPGVTPPLEWSRIPDGTNSFIIMSWNEGSQFNPYEWLLVNIDRSYTSVGEGSIIDGAETLKDYRGFSRPPQGQTYIIHYHVFAIKLPDPDVRLNFGSNPDQLDPTETFNQLIDYAKDADANSKSVSSVQVPGIEVLAVASLKGKFISD